MTNYILIRKGKEYQVITYNYERFTFDYRYMRHNQVKRILKADKDATIENPYKDTQIKTLEYIVKKN